MDEKNKQLLDQILKYAAERKIQIPADIVLKLSTIYAEDLYSELKQGQAPSEMEGKILMGTLRKLVEQIVLEEIPEFGLMNPGFVPAPGRAGLMLMSTGWKPYLIPSAPGGGGGGTGISDAPGDSQSYVRYNRTWIVMPPGVTQHSLLTGLDYASAGHTGFQPTLTGVATLALLLPVDGTGSGLDADLLDGNHAAAFQTALTFPLGADLGGTGIANAAASTLTLAAATSITGGGTLGLGGFTGSVPATGTFAMGAGTLTSATVNDVTGAAHTHAITASTALVAAGTAQYQVLTTSANPYPAGWSDFYLRGTTGGTTNFAVTNTKTLTLTSTGDFNLTIPATGTAALLATANAFTKYQTITNDSGIYALNLYANSDTVRPGVYMEGRRVTDGALAFTVFDLQIGKNGQALTRGGVIGILGTIADASTGTYLYLDGTSTGDYNNATLKLSSAGKVGIGIATTSSPSVKLHVVGDGTYSGAFESGKFGIGTVTPSFLFHVEGSSASAGLIKALIRNTNASGDARITLQNSATGTVSLSSTGSSYGSPNMAWVFTEGTLVGFGFQTNGDKSNNGTAYIAFSAGGYATTQETMRITAKGSAGCGKVGIGLTAPSSLFHLADQTTAAGITNIVNITALGSGANGDGGNIAYNGKTSTTAATAMGLDQWLWVNATHASRTARRVFNVYDTAIREAMRIEASGTAAMIGFLGAAAVVRPLATTDLGVALSDLGLRVAGTAYPITTSGAVSFTGGVTTSGGRVEGVTTYTDTCNILTTDECVIFNKATAFTATMPAATVGQRFYFKNIGAGNVTLSFPGTDTVDEVDDDLIMTQYDSYTLICRLANKWVKV